MFYVSSFEVFFEEVFPQYYGRQLFLLLLQIQKVPNFYPQPMSLHQRTWEMQISSILSLTDAQP
jgi:hypothetical protein